MEDVEHLRKWIPLLGKDETALSAIETLSDAGEPIVAALAAVLEQPTTRLMDENVGEVLVRIGNPSVAPLLAVLRSGKNPVIAASLFGQLGDTGAVEPLISVLNDKSKWVRWAATIALRPLRDRRAVEPLIKRLSDRFPLVRLEAANALREFGDARAVAPLSRLTRDRNPGIRQAAADALAVLSLEEAGHAGM